jgi:hypothetical protein
MERPLWVRLGLWGLGTRSMVMAFFVLSVVVATAVCAFVSWWGALIYLAATWYWFAMRWVDKHDSW